MVPSASTGRLAPITEASYPDGNVEVGIGSSGEMYRIVPVADRPPLAGRLRLNHWSNCAHRDRFRR